MMEEPVGSVELSNLRSSAKAITLGIIDAFCESYRWARKAVEDEDLASEKRRAQEGV